MSYATKSIVSEISGISEANISDTFLTLADSAVHRICNRTTFESIITAEEYFDTIRRNLYLEGDIGSREYPIVNWPVTSVDKVYLISRGLDSDSVVTVTTTELTLNNGYFLDNNERGCIVKISDGTSIPVGLKVIKVEYKYGYPTAPQDVKDFCNYYAAFLTESRKAFPTNSDGSPLAEVEIGRYRERYANPNTAYKSKYGDILSQMQDTLELRYKLWE